MLLDVPSALTVTLPTYSNPHVVMQPFGFFAQDEWHVKPESDRSLSGCAMTTIPR